MEDNIKVLTLDSIATLKELIGSGGGNTVTLYNAYGNNTDGALTQAFVSGKMNGDSITFGHYAQANGDMDIAIGRSAKNTAAYSIAIGNQANNVGNDNSIAIGNTAKTSPNSNGGSIAIGNSATVENGGGSSIAIGNNTNIGHSFSVALGSYAKTGRPSEVSIGTTATTASPKTRYLANVTAGTLDTDATNLKQVRDAVIGDVLYASAEAAAAITLSAVVSQYERLEIIGSWTMPFTETSTPLQVIAHWHLNDQDNSRTFQLRATDLDVANNQKTEVVETWALTSSTTIELVSGVQVSGELTTPEMEALDTPSIIITKVIGIKAI